MSEGRYYLARTLCAMVVVPVAALVVYPPVYLLLPESVQRRADLPQDLTLVILFVEAVVPVCGAWLYRRARRRSASASPGFGKRMEARDAD